MVIPPYARLSCNRRVTTWQRRTSYRAMIVARVIIAGVRNLCCFVAVICMLVVAAVLACTRERS